MGYNPPNVTLGNQAWMRIRYGTRLEGPVVRMGPGPSWRGSWMPDNGFQLIAVGRLRRPRRRLRRAQNSSGPSDLKAFHRGTRRSMTAPRRAGESVVFRCESDPLSVRPGWLRDVMKNRE